MNKKSVQTRADFYFLNFFIRLAKLNKSGRTYNNQANNNDNSV